ncbi:MAG TPA: ferritin-like domain-containing protein [Acidimicrobiales bacterium]|nr:ferritin-like domain-containing protein [Acidimicrobiales bacterium]
MIVELGDLGFDEGAHVLVKLALSADEIEVRGSHPDLLGQLASWCRQQGHRVRDGRFVTRGRFAGAAWVGAERAGAGAGAAPDDHPQPGWGLAARGAMVEPGGPAPSFSLADGRTLWSERAHALYGQAAAGQWDPAQAIDWDAPLDHGADVEAAVVQVMTFLVENEEAALVVPARFLGQVHPHFREIQQILAATVADEARHIEVFTRRALMTGAPLALSGAAGRTSLQTLLDEPDYATASFLLSVMGEGTFVSLLGFLERHAPDALTRRIAHLTRQDEARHVAFSMGHLERHASLEPDLRPRLARAVERRHHALRSTAGLNDEVFDSLVLLAAGEATPAAIARGWAAVQDLQRDMDENRRARLNRLGFTPGESEALSSLHTRNFM